MGQAAKTRVEIRDFQGLSIGDDSIDMEPGQSDDQVNAVSVGQGSLEIRRGYREVTFEN